MKYKVLIIEDTPEMLDYISRNIKNPQIEFDTATNTDEATEKIKNNVFNIYIIDVNLKDGLGNEIKEGGLSLLELINSINPLAKSVIVTNFGDYQKAKKAIKLGCYEWIDKEDLEFKVGLESVVNRALVDYKREESLNTSMNLHALNHTCPIFDSKLCGERNSINKIDRSKNVFLGIPFDGYGDREELIEETLISGGLIPKIANEEFFKSANFCKICKLIRSCKYYIVDISNSNKTILKPDNTLYELGIIHGMGENALILSDIENHTELPYNVQGVPITFYDHDEPDKINLELKKAILEWMRTLPNVDNEIVISKLNQIYKKLTK